MTACCFAPRRHCVFRGDRLRSTPVIQFKGRMKGTDHAKRGDVSSSFFRATFARSRVKQGVNNARWFAAPPACVVWLASGCFSPDLDGPCRVPCSAGCPDGWACNRGYCAPSGYQGDCSSLKAAGGAGSAGGVASNERHGGQGGSAGGVSIGQGGRSSSGGVPNDTAGAAPTGGVGSTAAGSSAGGTHSGTGGTSPSGSGGTILGAAGDGGDGGSAPSRIDVEPSQLGTLCSGDIELEFTASGGSAPYRWSVETTCGISLAAGANETATLRGSSAAGNCAIKLLVQDNRGAKGAFEQSLTFHERPSLDTTQLAPACLFEEFEVELAAHGGDASSRRFETTTPGWSVAGNKLRANVSAQTQRKVSVTVRDAYCPSPAVDLELPLEPSGSGRCFTLNAVPKPSPDAPSDSLPRPCAGMPYAVRLEVKPEPAAWKALLTPPGLQALPNASDPSAILLQGAASWAAGEKSILQLELVQSDGRRFLYDYGLIPRPKCWFAYVGRDQSLWQLRLWDPELAAHREFGAADAEVTSMAFSPDGKFLAYQAKRAGQVGLTLIDLRNLHEQPLSFTGNVEHYVWSPDSSLLAVVSRDTATILGGIDVSGVATSSQLETGVQGITYLEPLVTPIDAAPVWFGEHALALVTSSPPSSYKTRNVRRVGNAFSDAVDVPLSYAPAPMIVGFRGGYSASNETLLSFIDPSAWSTPTPYPHDFNAFSSFSPNGEFVGNTMADGTLNWFAPALLEILDPPAASSEPGQCHGLLAWTPDGSRVACVIDSEQGPLRFLERASTNPSSLSVSTNTNAYVYSEQSSNERRRVFSADGRLFAFTTDTDLYVVDAEHPRTFYTFKTSEGRSDSVRAIDANTIDLAFSSDGNFLIEHRAQKLTLVALTADSNRYWPLDRAMSLAPDCGEKYMVSPHTWCGAPSAPRDFRWSPHTNWFASLNQAHDLNMAYVQVGADTLTKKRVNPVCSGSCVRSLDFQP